MLEVSRVRFDDPADSRRWQEYVCGRRDSQCTDLAEWRRLYRELYGFDDHSWVAVQDGAVSAALSLYHIRSPLMGRMLVTCPFFGYGGFYWENEASRQALLDHAWDTARELGVDYIEIRSTERLPPPFQANVDFAEFNLDLGATTEETWTTRLSSNVRQNIRKSRTHELEFRLSTNFGPCRGLLQRTLREHGTPFHGRRFFELLDAHLGDQVRYAEVWHDGRLLAGGVAVRFKHTLITPYIGSLVRSRTLRPNYLLYWGLIERYAEEHGLRRFEMGRSPRGSTHARFKKKWGCREVPLFYNYRTVGPAGRYRSVSRPSAVNRLALRVWRHLPLVVTSAIGPKLFRYIP